MFPKLSFYHCACEESNFFKAAQVPSLNVCTLNVVATDFWLSIWSTNELQESPIFYIIVYGSLAMGSVFVLLLMEFVAAVMGIRAAKRAFFFVCVCVAHEKRCWLGCLFLKFLS